MSERAMPTMPAGAERTAMRATWRDWHALTDDEAEAVARGRREGWPSAEDGRSLADKPESGIAVALSVDEAEGGTKDVILFLARGGTTPVTRMLRREGDRWRLAAVFVAHMGRPDLRQAEKPRPADA